MSSRSPEVLTACSHLVLKRLSLVVEEDQGHEKYLKIMKTEMVVGQVFVCPFHVGGTGNSGGSERHDPWPFGNRQCAGRDRY